MKLLLDKLEDIRKALGSDRVYDVISEIVPGARLDQLFREALARQRPWSEILDFVEKNVSRERVEAIQQSVRDALAARHIDLAAVIEQDRLAREQRLIPEYVERFFLEAFELFGGHAARRQDGLLRIDRVPYEIQQASPDVRRKYGPVDKEYRKVTFRKSDLMPQPDATFLGPGHPLFEAVVDRVLREFSPELRRGAVFYDPDRKEAQQLVFQHIRVQDGRGDIVGGRLYAMTQVNGQPGTLPLAYLLDCKPGQNENDATSGLPPRDENALLEWAYDHVFQLYLEEIQERRLRETEVAERHIRMSLDALIAESQSKLMKYRREVERGRPMEVAIRQEEARKRDLEERQARRLRELVLERNLSLSTPEVLGSAVVLPMPASSHGAGMARDEEVEALAMRIAVQSERDEGWVPVDVSKENLGFDVRSTAPGEAAIRYIEVKGRAGVGAVWLTPNEWRMAERFGPDYWLYVVYNTGTKPELRRVRDPVKSLPVVEEKEIVRYIVPPDSVAKAAGAA